MGADRDALLVGVWDYQKLEPLHSPRGDVDELHKVLEDSTIGDYQVTCLQNPHREDAVDALGDFFAGRRPHETVLVYLSGHGIRDAGGAFFFTTVESERERPWTAVPGDFLRGQMSRCRAGTIILLVDCCHSGAILSQLKGSSSAAPDRSGRGRAILTATRVEEDASQGPDRRLSVFTEGIVDGLATGRADPGKTGLITAHSLYDYVSGWVEQKRPEQHPDALIWGAPVIARTPRVSVVIPDKVQPPPIDRRAETGTPAPPETSSLRDRARQLRSTLRRLDRVVHGMPGSLSLLRQRAWIRSELGEHCQREEALKQYAMALEDLNACLAMRPRDPVALRVRGHVRRMLGSYDHALEDLNSCLELRPYDAVALRVRGDVLRMLGRYEQSLEDVNTCLAARPDDAVALRVRGDVLRALGRYDQALSDLDRSLDLRPADQVSMRIRDDVQRAVDQSRSVADRLDRILERIPDDPVALGMHARACRMVGDYGRALQDVNRLLADRPDDVGALRLRGEIRYAQAEYGPALTDFDQVLTRRPGDPIVGTYAKHARQAHHRRRPLARLRRQ